MLNGMKLAPPANPNYAAVVVALPAINQLEGCDNIVGAPILGHQAIVGKDTKVGDIGVVFTAETQLSEEFTRVNNLHRDKTLNADPEQVGYLEPNRRVRAIKLRKHRSDALFLPLSALAYTGIDPSELQVGDTFDTLNGHEICRKFEAPRQAGAARVEKNRVKTFKRVDEKQIPQHFSTDNYFRVSDQIPAETRIVATQKLHGCSIRLGHALVARKLSLRDRIARSFGVNVVTTEFDNIYASRRVIKDANHAGHAHFYDSDVWTHYGKRLDGVLPKSYVLYGELIGWSPEGAPLQPGFTYRIPKGDADIYAYRIAVVNDQGISVDLSWDAVKQFCVERGIKHVPELWSGVHGDFEPDVWLDKRYRDSGHLHAVPLEPGKTVDEGVVLRAEGIAPYFAKLKSPAFLQYETRELDKGTVDLESLGDAA